ncbi:MAG: hypothetical protein ACYC4R_11635 [Anaerolineae bacterium]
MEYARAMPEQLERLRQADALRRKENFRQAIAIYQDLIRTAGEDAHLCRMVAICYADLAWGEPEAEAQHAAEALRWQERAVALAPESGLMHAVLAEIIWYHIFDDVRAAQEYRTAVALEPNDELVVLVAVQASEVLLDLFSDEEVLAWSERLVQLQPDKADYRARLAMLYYQHGRVADGDRQTRQAFLCHWPAQEAYVEQLQAAWRRAHAGNAALESRD